jgi:transposase-like protein
MQKRKKFNKEFKVEVIRLMEESGESAEEREAS